MNSDRPQNFQQGKNNQWLAMHNGLKGSPLENGAMANGHYSDSLSRKLDQILNNHEHSDVEDAENISVQGNLEMQVSKLLDDTEDEISSNPWSASSSSSSVEHLGFLGMGMYEGACNSNLELSTDTVQPLGVELAAALDSSSRNSSNSEETVGEEDDSVLCVYNIALDPKNAWIGSDNDLSIVETGKDKEECHRRPSSTMYPSSRSSSNSIDSDDNEIVIKNPSERHSIITSPISIGITPQGNETENSHSTKSPTLLHVEQCPISQEAIEKIPPVHSHVLEPILLETKTEQEVLDSHSAESPNSESHRTTSTTNTLTDKPTISHQPTEEGGDVKSSTSEDSCENELELIKLQVCLMSTTLLIVLIIFVSSPLVTRGIGQADQDGGIFPLRKATTATGQLQTTKNCY